MPTYLQRDDQKDVEMVKVYVARFDGDVMLDMKGPIDVAKAAMSSFADVSTREGWTVLVQWER